VRLRTVNNLLLSFIVLINGYVILAPLWPSVSWHFANHQVARRHLETVIAHPAADSLPVGNTVVIPSMELNQPILEGPASKQYRILDQGIWRLPSGSTPDRGSNTVLIGHRFTYTNPRGVFYFLNKMAIGDELAIFWNGHEYRYKVRQITEVQPTDTSIENPTDHAQLTLFTCTPLWLPKDRLVVGADLESHS
jgi:LPXTG-site transpeptidase (sortase) family protein